MENCIICLENNEDILSRITTRSSEWIEGKMRRIIEKHLWWWYLNPKSNELIRWICRPCWNEIYSFHRFYDKVERAHRRYHSVVRILNQINAKEEEIRTINIETSRSAESSKKQENKLMLDKEQRKERPRKHDNFEEILLDVEVKTEFSCSSNEYVINGEFTNADGFDEDAPYNQEFRDNNDSSSSEESLPIVNRLKMTKLPNGTLKTNIYRRKEEARKKIKAKRIKSKEDEHSGTINYDDFFKEIQYKLECCICNVALFDFPSLKAHYRKEHNTQGYVMCCGNKYFKRCLLYDHLKVHKDPNFFKCQICSKPYATRRALKTHLKTHEMRERKYNCDECGKSYFSMDFLNRHKLTHVPENEKHFNCSQCSKKFASDYLRRQHENLTHAKIYFKICDICGKSFYNTRSFLRHLEEHGKVPPSKVTCDICGAKLANKKGLGQHVKKHLEEEQACPYCSKVSPNLSAHRKHINYTHTMQRKHACHLCDKAFRLPLELKEHLCTHTGETLYTCPHCPRTFVSHANMYKHRKTVHDKEKEENRLK